MNADHSAANDLNTHLQSRVHGWHAEREQQPWLGERKGRKREKVKNFGDRDRGRYGIMREQLSVSPCAPGAVPDPVKRGLSLSPLAPPPPLSVPMPIGTEESLE